MLKRNVFPFGGSGRDYKLFGICLADTGFTFPKIAVSGRSEAEPRYSYLKEGKSCICQKQMPNDEFIQPPFILISYKIKIKKWANLELHFDRPPRQEPSQASTKQPSNVSLLSVIVCKSLWTLNKRHRETCEKYLCSVWEADDRLLVVTSCLVLFSHLTQLRQWWRHNCLDTENIRQLSAWYTFAW